MSQENLGEVKEDAACIDNSFKVLGCERWKDIGGESYLPVGRQGSVLRWEGLQGI